MPASNQLRAIQVQIMRLPDELPKTLSFLADLRSATSVEVDLSSQQMLALISMVQTIFIDNSLNTALTSATAGITNQKLVCPPRAQCYLPFALVSQPKILIQSAGGVQVPIQLLNVPVPSQVWRAT